MAEWTRPREGPLSWAQTEWVMHLPRDGASSYEDNLYTEWAGDPVPTEAARAALLDLVARHEPLRTTIHRGDDGTGWQRVHAPHERAGEIVSVVDDADLADALAALKRTCFTLSAEWPVRAVIGDRAGRTRRLGLVADHSACDGWALRVLADDLHEAVARRAGRDRLPPPRPTRQPLDDAGWESSTAGQSYADRARNHWERQFRTLGRTLDGYRPPVLDPAPPVRPDSFHDAFFSSPRLNAVGNEAAERWRTSVSALYLAAFGGAVAELEQAPCVCLMMVSANRVGVEAGRALGKRNMPTPILVPARSDAGLGGTLADTARQQIVGHRFANLDPLLGDTMSATINPALHHTALCYARFNFTTSRTLGLDVAVEPRPFAHLPEIVPPPLDQIIHKPRRQQGPKYMLLIHQRPDTVLVNLRWRDDTGWNPHAESVLYRIDELVTAMLTASDDAPWPPPTEPGPLRRPSATQSPPPASRT
ncbi:condensation domain-containing protein [Micromonospora sp. NPDC092111]|uniref:condensation domain-containing protein n=1 Tax=Micromonospora sp. NPDC092111 TaxID=3364289 RepID=UPI00380A911E